MAAEAAASGALAPRPFRVAAIRDETEGVRTLALSPPEGVAPRFAPGQFSMLYVFGVGESAISISGDPDAAGAPLEHTVRAVGAVTRALTALGPGATVGLRGPFGAAWPLGAQLGRRLLFVAGGLGLAPLRPAILSALARRRDYADLALIVGARSPEAMLYRGQLRDWAERGLRVFATVDHAGRDWTGRVGAAPRAIPAALAGGAAADVAAFVCGPEVMMRFTARALSEAGAPAERIWLSMERNMKCAIGRCGRCQFGPDFVCRDGPVLRYNRIARRLEIREL